MERPKVTIGLPVRNNNRSVRDSLRSIYCQTLTDWELIIVDDASTDGTTEFLESIKDPRVRLIKNRNPCGLASSLNRITKSARGNIIARIDADDLMVPTRMEEQVNDLTNSREYMVVGSPVYCINDMDVLLGITSESPVVDSPQRALKGSLLVHPSITAYRDWFEKYLYDEDLLRSQDRDLWIRASGKGEIKKTQEPLTFKRIGSSINRDYLDKYCDSIKYSQRIVGRHCLKLNAKKAAVKEIARLEFNKWVMKAAFLLRLEKRILARRYREFKDEEYDYAWSLLQGIKSTSL